PLSYTLIIGCMNIIFSGVGKFLIKIHISAQNLGQFIDPFIYVAIAHELSVLFAEIFSLTRAKSSRIDFAAGFHPLAHSSFIRPSLTILRVMA
ncbi:hypothetical protein ACO1ZW_24635, partial [Enterobacter kobei]